MHRTLLALAIVIGSNGGGVNTGSTGARDHHRTGSASGSSHGSSRGGGSTRATGGSGTSDAPPPPSSSSSSGHAPPVVGPPTGGGYTTYHPGQPVALFTVTSPVAPGQPVQYLNESYDTTAGISILSASWQGRSASFPRAGLYPVTLTVIDGLGRSASLTIDVLVSAATASAPAGEPNAFFLVTSPIAAGQPVTYVDESYDMDAGATIVNEQWSGRLATFPSPGTYPVSLRVEDSTGVWSATFTRDVVVTASAPGPASAVSGPPSSLAWSVAAEPNPATSGQVVTVTASASGPSPQPPTLLVPPALEGSWNGVSYAADNAGGAMTPAGPDSFVRTLTIPADPAFPPGTYRLGIEPPGGQPIIVALVVQATAQYVEPVISGS